MRRLWLALLLSIVACVSHAHIAPGVHVSPASLVLCSANYAGANVTLNCRPFSESEWAHANPQHALFASTGRPPIIPPSWAVPEWDIDPSATLPCTSDNNTCTSTTCGSGLIGPCKSYQEIVARWGTVSPQMRQPSLVIKFLSAHTDNSDPVIADPSIQNGAAVSIQCVPNTTICGSGATLANVTSLVRGTNLTLAQVNLSGGGACTLAANELVCDTTNPGCAWTYAVNAGSVWKFSQIFVPHVAGSGDLTAPSTSTWTNGDQVTVMTLPEVNILEFLSLEFDNNATNTNSPEIYRCSIFDPRGAAVDPTWLGADVFIAESQTERTVMNSRTISVYGQRWLLNDNIVGGMELGMAPSNLATQIIGGVLQNNVYLRGLVSLDGDVIVNTFNPLMLAGELTAPANISYQEPSIGRVYIESGKKVRPSSGGVFASRFGAPSVYGAGSINIIGPSRWVYPTGAGGAAATFLQSGGFQLNGQTGAWLVTPSASPTANKTVSASNLDADLGAASGCYANPGGASICNTAAAGL